jgi:hypothetical protein
MPNGKKNKYFRAFEPIATDGLSAAIGSLSFYRSFADV